MSTEENQRKEREEKDWEKVANRASRSRRIWSYVTGETELSGCDVARKNDDCYYRSRNSTSRPVQARIRIETCDSSKKYSKSKLDPLCGPMLQRICERLQRGWQTFGKGWLIGVETDENEPLKCWVDYIHCSFASWIFTCCSVLLKKRRPKADWPKAKPTN